ncbi:PIGW [Bugula neritina]|uniref:Phosphatidylinositol-glycan biosynthesis class W protein n=1 Tax=Bugula neritina TaxID=10212 RepID=A0A7J7JYB8_BUGNE|nr:PIGW [Bugula neritina]
MDESKRALKEQFVSHLNGTTWIEVDFIQLVQPLCTLLFSSFCCFIFQGHKVNRHEFAHTLAGKSLMYVVDFGLCVIPLLATLTVFADHYMALTQTMLAMALLFLATTCTNFKYNSLKEVMNKTVDKTDRSYISWYRAYVNVLTAICILAVDFKMYPRRLAKTETFGTGLMDIFVGAFIMCNSIVCKEATDSTMELRGFSEKLASLKKVLRTSLPLTILGVARLISTKSSNYQEHVTEYGVHWNFFLTLAAVRLLCTAMLCVLKPSKAALLSVSFAATYQYLLSHKLQEYILREGGRHSDLLSANREGIFSLLGYMSLYFAGVTIGRIIFQKKRMTWGDNFKLALQLLLLSGISLLGMLVARAYGIDVSRRMANLTFILWTIHHSALVVAAMLAVFLLHQLIDLVFTGYTMLYY